MELPLGSPRERLGLPEQLSLKEVSKLLIDMISKSLGDSMVNQEVEVFGMDETLERLQVVFTPSTGRTT